VSKAILLLAAGLAALLVTLPAAAGAPSTLSYQGVLTDENGVVVPDGPYTLRFEVFTAVDDLTPVFSQDLGVEVTHGLYNVILSGSSGSIPTDLAIAFDDANQGRYMQVTILSGGGLDGTVLSPRQEIASVPYALTALSLAEPLTPSVREVEFVTSTATGLTIDEPAGSWFALRNSDNTADIEASVTPPATGCIVEVSAGASFETGDPTVSVLLSLTENGAPVASAVGAVAKNDGGGGVAMEFVHNDPPLAELTYGLQARTNRPGDTATQGVDDFNCSSCGAQDDAGAWIKIVMECQE
jgi:hypothetical protein